jgi:hypothetical protein
MPLTISRKPQFRVYAEARRTFIETPSQQVQAVRELLSSHGIRTHYPRPVILGRHYLELITDVELEAVQILLDDWAARRQEAAGLNGTDAHGLKR